MSKKSGKADWELKLLKLIREADLLEEEDALVYITLLKSKKPLTGSQLSGMFPQLKRTHIYSILTRLQENDFVEITNPGRRPAEYEALEPLRAIEVMIRDQQSRLDSLQILLDYTKKEVIPKLSRTGIFGGRVSNTFVIPDRRDFIEDIRNEIENADFRVMGHVTQDLFREIKDPLIRTTKRIREGQPDTWEYERDHHSFTVVSDTPDLKLEKEYPSSLVFQSNSVETEIIIVDNTTYISNIDTNLGLVLKIEDESVTEVHRVVLINTYLTAGFDTQTSKDINKLGKFVGSNEKIRNTVKALLRKGWKISRENTDISGHETGIVSPTSGFGLFRLGGLVYYPFDNENGEEILNQRFEAFVNQSDYYIQSLQRQFETTRKLKKEKISGYDLRVLEVKIKARDDWKTVLNDVPDEILTTKGLTGPAIIGINLEKEGAFLIWGLNPNNVRTIFDTFLQQ